MGGGVVFIVCVPTANFERILLRGPRIGTAKEHEDLLKLNVELRNKNVPPSKSGIKRFPAPVLPPQGDRNFGENIPLVPMEKVLDELLVKLEIEHVVWCADKNANYYEVIFPVPAGDPCENCIHCLTELGIGKKLNSVVSVVPCSVTFNSIYDRQSIDDSIETAEQKKTWENFVSSVRSKLTVKQVVDGVRSGGDLTFDYIMLVLTADCLAALGLVENNASNIVAAMLVSPLMGPVMSLTFGTIIADRQLQLIGFKSLFIGMLISCIFGLIFGLILGTTEMPWGFGDFPTEEMKGRGNVRALWMGVLWALPSGTGVALALLQGSAGPLIGVAISASLLPPVVNCGLFWALGCIWILYPGIKIPHIHGEAYTGNSSYQPLYTDYIPVEFFINGIVSCCLTLVNVICIFITAIIVLKIKEVAAPYTSTPDLRRFWEHDIRIVRETNRSTLQAAEEDERQAYMQGLNKKTQADMDEAMERVLKEATDDETFRRVQRSSYSLHVPDDIPRQFGYSGDSTPSGQRSNRNSALTDLAALDKLITSLLGTQQAQSSPILSRLHPLQSSLRRSKRGRASENTSPLPTIMESNARRNNDHSPSTSGGIRNLIQNLPQRFSMDDHQDEENINLTKNTN